jgi:hypothetical protein
VFSTHGSITTLAADGNRAAVVPRMAPRYCGRILVWTAPGRKARSYKANACAGLLCKSCVTEVALGGGQLAWISIGGGNNQEMILQAARLSGGAARWLEHAVNGQGAGGGIDGDYVGRLLGSGPLLAYSGWTVDCIGDGAGDCQGWPIAQEKLVRVVARRNVVVGRGSSFSAQRGRRRAHGDPVRRRGRRDRA